MKTGVIVAVAAFAVTLAVIVGMRMSAEAMAVMIGVVCGVAAGIPTSLLVVFVTRALGASRDGGAEPRQGATYPAYPPVVVMGSGTPTGWPPQSYLPPVSQPAPEGDIHVVGVGRESAY